MSKYHINRDGEPGLCRASVKSCPFGGEDEHFKTQEAAQQAYDAQMESYKDYRGTLRGKLDAMLEKSRQATVRAVGATANFLNERPGLTVGITAGVVAVAAGVVGYALASKYFNGLSSNPIKGEIVGADVQGYPTMVGKINIMNYYTNLEVSGPKGEIFNIREPGIHRLDAGSPITLHEYSNGVITLSSAAASAGPTIATATGVSAVAGGIAGAGAAILAQTGIDRLYEYLDSKWALRHDKHFGLLRGAHNV